jgi:hypothetical protein
VLIGYMHTTDASMRRCAAYKGNFLRAWKIEICDILPPTAQKPLVLLARHGSPDTETGHCDLLG